MTTKLYDILTDDELSRLKLIGLTRNVKIYDLTIRELEELILVMFPNGLKTCNVNDVWKQLIIRKAL